MADVYSAVVKAVAEALALDDHEVSADSTLMDDLGAQSIDLVDILFRIEQATGVRIEASDIGRYMQGGIPDDEFSDDEQIISAKGAEQLSKVMPQAEPSELAGRVSVQEVMKLFTVHNLADMVRTRGGDGAHRVKLRVGIDGVAVARLKRVVADDERRQATLFTERELAYCRGKRRCYEHMAARFAAKEAVLKAFGTGISQRMRWTDVEVVNDPSGRPRVRLGGAVASFAERHGLQDLDVSLTHTEDLAFAHAVSVWDERGGRSGPST